MRAIWRWSGAGLLVTAGVAGSCGRSENTGLTEAAPARTERAAPAAPAAPVAAAAPTDVADERARIVARVDSVDRALRKVRGLTREERAALRQDVNAEQLAVAQSGGVRASSEGEVTRLRRSGRLVELEDTTSYWVLRDLTHSVPLSTPSARGMLLEASRRFQARMDEMGLPRFRLTVTSVLRTDESQADLRQSNSNAAAGVSTHEYGTTMDISHIRFAPPAAKGLPPELSQLQDSLMEDVARRHASALQGELGRVLGEMRREGKVKVMMERQQPVYHTTVSARIRAPEHVE
ncbi:MAG TPA: DUF5715 family protein [Longimicrobium sp.]|nr:DUF5715 family protein [Longimicrobium sp.]